jgi:hypothetical protein
MGTETPRGGVLSGSHHLKNGNEVVTRVTAIIAHLTRLLRFGSLTLTKTISVSYHLASVDYISMIVK